VNPVAAVTAADQPEQNEHACFTEDTRWQNSSMGLNIKNDHIHDLVKRLAQLTEQSQSRAVEDAVRRRLQELEREQGLPDYQWTRVEAVIEAAHRHLTSEQKAALARAEDDLYDENGLPA